MFLGAHLIVFLIPKTHFFPIGLPDNYFLEDIMKKWFYLKKRSDSINELKPLFWVYVYQIRIFSFWSQISRIYYDFPIYNIQEKQKSIYIILQKWITVTQTQ